MDRDEVDRWIAYHSRISYDLTTERTALESALIPVSAYILVACRSEEHTSELQSH